MINYKSKSLYSREASSYSTLNTDTESKRSKRKLLDMNIFIGKILIFILFSPCSGKRNFLTDVKNLVEKVIFKGENCVLGLRDSDTFPTENEASNEELLRIEASSTDAVLGKFAAFVESNIACLIAFAKIEVIYFHLRTLNTSKLVGQ